MARVTDQAYLRQEQYRTPANLTARANLHRRFSTNPDRWLPWVIGQIGLRPGERVLEVGGGPGWLWRENRERLPAGLRVLFTDYSPGMVRTARSALGGAPGFEFANADVQALPSPEAAFDLVVANHMLYHVPDLPVAMRELARVLRRGGRLCAATNGQRHMRELYDLVHQFDPRYPDSDRMAGMLKYRLENAAEWLASAFARVEVRRHPDSLWVTEARALGDYARSGTNAATLAGDDRAAGLEAFIQTRLESAGGLHITKDVGVVLAWVD